MKKIIALAMGIALFTESYGNAACPLTPTTTRTFGAVTPPTQRYIPNFNKITYAPNPSRLLQEPPAYDPLNWTDLPFSEAAKSLVAFVNKDDPLRPLDDPTPLPEYNPLVVDHLNQFFRTQGTNHLAIMRASIDGQNLYLEPRIFFSGLDREHIRSNLNVIKELYNIDLRKYYSETLGSVGYTCSSPQAYAHSERAAILWLINNLQDIIKSYESPSNLLIQLKIAHPDGICPYCLRFLNGEGHILKGTNMLVGRKYPDPRRTSFNIWNYFPKGTKIKVSNDAGKLLLTIEDGNVINGLQANYFNNPWLEEPLTRINIGGLQANYLNNLWPEELPTRINIGGLQANYLNNLWPEELPTRINIVGLQANYLNNLWLAEPSTRINIGGLQANYLNNLWPEELPTRINKGRESKKRITLLQQQAKKVRRGISRTRWISLKRQILRLLQQKIEFSKGIRYIEWYSFIEWNNLERQMQQLLAKFPTGIRGIDILKSKILGLLRKKAISSIGIRRSEWICLERQIITLLRYEKI